MVKSLFFLLILAASVGSEVQAAPKMWNVYVADWGKDQESDLVVKNISHIKTAWMKMFNVLPDGHLDLKWKPQGPVAIVLKKIQTLKTKPSYGPLLQNYMGGGFSKPYGRHILNTADKWLPDLLESQKIWKFDALQLDVESLDPSDAELFEKASKKIATFCKEHHLNFSIALHAQTEIPSSNEGARFQRWSELKLIPAQKVLLAMDYSWPGGTPGAIAPAAWVNNLAMFAKTFFSAKDLCVTLPLYGYHWRKGELGQSALPAELKTIVLKKSSGWKLDAELAKKGTYFYQKNQESISFEDSVSISARRSDLEKLGIQDFAFWKAGGETSTIYR